MPREVELRRTAALVPCQQDEILSGEQIHRQPREDPRQSYAVGSDRNVGDHRVGQPARDERYRTLDGLVGTDELRGTVPLQRELFEQRAVDIAPQPEGEQTRATQHRDRLGHQRRRTALADRGLAIGDEQRERQSRPIRRRGAILRRHGERREQRRFDVRGPFGLELVQIPFRVPQVFRSGGLELIAKGPHVSREVDQSEAVARRQRGEHLPPRGARLLELAPAHGPRHIEHKREIARRRRYVHGRRRHGDEREAGPITGRVGQHRDRRGRRVGDRQEDRDVARGPVDPNGPAIAVAGRSQRMRRRVRGAEPIRRAIGQREERRRSPVRPRVGALVGPPGPVPPSRARVDQIPDRYPAG